MARTDSFRVMGSYICAPQIPDKTLRGYGTRCANCRSETGYFEQICRHCGIPFIGPLGFPDISVWKVLDAKEKKELAKKVCEQYHNRGRFKHVNAMSVPLTPEELQAVEALEGEEAEIFEMVHNISPREISTRLKT
jgi:hypothetical protein